MARMLFEADCNPTLIKSRTVAMIGYGSQGRAQALNLRDSGVEVRVGLRAESPRREIASADGFTSQEPAGAAVEAEVVVLNVSDNQLPAVYRHLEPSLRHKSALVFSHGFNIHYNLVKPRPDLDVILVAPKGQGDGVRKTYVEGHGMPALVAVHQDATGGALELAKSYGWAIGCARAMLVESSFAEETEADLFSEQAILCGGLKELVKMGFETLIEEGYAPEAAYFECLHELKLIVDLMVERGVAGMLDRISDTAEWGAYVGGPEIIGAEARIGMSRILANIKSGGFAASIAEMGDQFEKVLDERRAHEMQHPIEVIGERLRPKLRPH